MQPEESKFDRALGIATGIALAVGLVVVACMLVWVSKQTKSLSGKSYLTDAGSLVSADFQSGSLLSTDVMTIKTTTGIYLIQGRQSFTNGTRLWINNNPAGRQLCWSKTGNGDTDSLVCRPTAD